MKLFKIALVNVLFSWIVEVCDLDSRRERVTRINWSNWISINPILQPPCRENLGCGQTVAEKSICSVLFFRTLKSCPVPHLQGTWVERGIVIQLILVHPSIGQRILCACPVFLSTCQTQCCYWLQGPGFVTDMSSDPFDDVLTRFVTNSQQTVLASDTDQSALYHLISIPLFAHYCLRVNLYIQSLWKFF